MTYWHVLARSADARARGRGGKGGEGGGVKVLEEMSDTKWFMTYLRQAHCAALADLAPGTQAITRSRATQ